MQNINTGFDLKFKVFIFMGLYFIRIQVKLHSKILHNHSLSKVLYYEKEDTNAFKKQNNWNEIQVKYMYRYI